MQWSKQALDIYLSLMLCTRMELDEIHAVSSAAYIKNEEPDADLIEKISQEYFTAKSTHVENLKALNVQVFVEDKDGRHLVSMTEGEGFLASSTDEKLVWWPTHFASYDDCSDWLEKAYNQMNKVEAA